MAVASPPEGDGPAAEDNGLPEYSGGSDHVDHGGSDDMLGAAEFEAEPPSPAIGAEEPSIASSVYGSGEATMSTLSPTQLYNIDEWRHNWVPGSNNSTLSYRW